MTNTKQLIAALSIASLMGAAGTSSWQPSKQRGSRGRVNTHTKDSKAKRNKKQNKESQDSAEREYANERPIRTRTKTNPTPAKKPACMWKNRWNKQGYPAEAQHDQRQNA